MRTTKFIFTGLLGLLTTFSFGQLAPCYLGQSNFIFDGIQSSRAIINGDFDEDGNLDVIVSQYANAANGIRYIKGNGDGTFQAPITIPHTTNRFHNGLLAVDINNDGHLDFVATTFNMLTTPTVHRIQFYINDGSGNFTEITPQTHSINSFESAMADLNNDGFKDLVIASSNTNLKIFPGTLAAPYVSNTPIEINIGSHKDVKIADVDNDGILDIVTLTAANSTIRLMKGNNTGSFTFDPAIVVSASSTNGEHLAVYDLNGDNKLDIAVTSANGVNILINDSGSTFFAPVNIPTSGQNSIGIEVQNVIGSTHPDIIVANSSTNSISIFQGDGTGSFTLAETLFAAGNPRKTTIADFNEDGFLDIVNNTSTISKIQFHKNNGNLSFLSDKYVSVLAGTTLTRTGDVNNDNHDDIVAFTTTTNSFQFKKWDQALNKHVNTQSFTTTIAADFQLADVNNDGFNDVIAIHTAANIINIFNGGASTISTTPTSISLPAGFNPTSIKRANLNGDTFTDFVLINNAGAFLTITSNGDGTLTQGTVNSSLPLTNPLAIVHDINGNGTDDILLYSTTEEHSFLNSGSGVFGPSITRTFQVPAGTTLQLVEAGDFNNDGNSDDLITVFQNSSGATTIYLQARLAASFGATTTIATPATSLFPKHITKGLFNADSKEDFAISFDVNPVGTGTFVIYTQETGSFLPYENNVGANPTIIQTADFDNDGSTDISVLNVGQSNIEIFMGAGAKVQYDETISLCVGSTLDLSVSSNSFTNILWSNGATTPTINVNNPGPHSYTASISNSTCTVSSNAVTLVFTPAPAITISGSTSVCAGNSTTLTFSGATTFEYENATLVNNELTVSPTVTTNYTVSALHASGCTSDTTITVSITAAPDATFSAIPASICETASPITLSPSTAGGTFTGNGVSGTTFNPASLTGNQPITYTVTYGTGCQVNTTQTINITAEPDATFTGADALYCQSSSAATLTPTIAGGTFTGNGVSGNSFNPANAILGNNTIYYSLTQNSCTAIDSFIVEVIDAPDASFTGVTTNQCINDGPLTLTPSTLGGTFTGDGINGNIFNPMTAGVGTKTISYAITLAGCSATETMSVSVNQNPSAVFTGLASSYCESAPVVTLAPIVTGGVFSGNGIVGTTFNPSLAENGANQIIYTLTVNGCTSTQMQTTTITGLPDDYLQLNGNVITAVNLPNTTYQWFNCNDINQTTIGTMYTFLPPSSGSYAVRINNNGCQMVSDCFLSTLSLDDMVGTSYQLYPNPTTGVFTLEISSEGELEMYDLTGKMVYQASFTHGTTAHELPTSLERGLYQLVIRSNDNVIFEKIQVNK